MKMPIDEGLGDQIPRGIDHPIRRPRDPAADVGDREFDYCLVAGERRVRAADMAGVVEIPAIICSYEETEALKVALLENIQRENLNPVEEALAFPSWKDKSVYGTLLKGENIYESSLDPAPLVLFGNEARGMSPGLKQRIGKALTIPSFSPSGAGSESLNLASSVAVVCSELRRPTQSGN